jgi:hypothetical protein
MVYVSIRKQRGEASGRRRPKLSKSVRKSRQINSTIKSKGMERKLTETRLKNAEKGKDYAGREV